MPRSNDATQHGAPQADEAVSVRIYKPSPELEGYVTFYYFVETAGPLTDFLYPEWGNVRFALSGTWRVDMPGYRAPEVQAAVLFGPTDRHGLIQTSGGKAVGFGLTPIGWHRFVEGHAGALANQVVPFETQLGAEGADLMRLLQSDESDEQSVARFERLLMTRLNTRPPVSPVVLAIDRALRTRPAEVTEFAAQAGVSARTLQRLCLRSFGFAPKRLMRLQRFLDTLGRVRVAVGQRLEEAISEDYFDQPHFYRDFREFMSMSPKTYFSAPRILMAAAAEAQMRAGVTLSFRLPPPPDA